MRVVSFEEFLKIEGQVIFSEVSRDGIIEPGMSVKVQNFNNDFCYDDLDMSAVTGGCGLAYDTNLKLAFAGVDVGMDFSESTTRMGAMLDHPRYAVYSKADVVALRDRLNEVIEKSEGDF